MRVWGAGFRVQGIGSRIKRVEGLRCRALGGGGKASVASVMASVASDSIDAAVTARALVAGREPPLESGRMV